MFSEEQISDLTALFIETGQAHHQAYIETEGDDPEWPIWYAEYMHEKVMDIFNLEFTKSELVYLLVAADLDQKDEESDEPWPTYYASFFSKSLA